MGYANPASATNSPFSVHPMALDSALQEKKIKPGDLVVLIGSGVGYNQAGIAFRIAEDGARLFIK